VTLLASLCLRRTVLSCAPFAFDPARARARRSNSPGVGALWMERRASAGNDERIAIMKRTLLLNCGLAGAFAMAAIAAAGTAYAQAAVGSVAGTPATGGTVGATPGISGTTSTIGVHATTPGQSPSATTPTSMPGSANGMNTGTTNCAAPGATTSTQASAVGAGTTMSAQAGVAGTGNPGSAGIAGNPRGAALGCTPTMATPSSSSYPQSPSTGP
jgi:hypothetical protein